MLRANTFATIFLLSSAALALTACGDGAKEDAKKAEAEKAKLAGKASAVTVAVASLRTFSPKIALSGQVVARNEAAVFAQSSGARITALMVDVGDTVRAGQPLARLDAAFTGADSALAAAQVVQARAALKESEIGLRQSRSDLQRAQSLGGEAVLSAEQIEQRKSAADSAAARLDVARASLGVAQAQQAQTSARQTGGAVLSPVSGLVIARSARVGEVAGAGGEPLFRIVGGGALEVSAQIPESDVNSLQVGQAARFRIPDGSEITAALRVAPAAIDAASRTGLARFQLPADGRVKSGMFLDGSADLPARQALAIPATALVFGREGPFVYVVDKENRARKTFVRTGRRDGAYIELLGGPAPGQTVVVGGAAFLADGDRIAATTMKGQAAAAPAPPASAVTVPAASAAASAKK